MAKGLATLPEVYSFSLPAVPMMTPSRLRCDDTSGASVKSMNFAGVAVIRETRHRTRCSRGFDFLALAIPALGVPPGLTVPAPNAATSM